MALEHFWLGVGEINSLFVGNLGKDSLGGLIIIAIQRVSQTFEVVTVSTGKDFGDEIS